MKALLYVGGDIPQELPDEIGQDIHPMVEYLLLNRQYGVSLESLKPSNNLSFHWKSTMQALQAGFDTILATGEDIGLPIALILFSIRSKAHLSIIFHGSYLNSPKFRLVAKILARQRRIRLLCLSESLRQCLIEEYGFRNDSIVNCGYGVDTNFFHPQVTTHAGRPLVVSAGTANRDYKLLLQAFRGLNADLHIASDSSWYPQPTNLTGVTIPENIQVKSAGNYSGLRELYARASFVVVPLRDCRHACGYAVIGEAMAMGKAVIATRTQMPCDYIIEGKTGFWVPPGDERALRERIELLLNNPDLAQCMGAESRRYIDEHFTLDAYTARIAQSSGIA